MSANADQGGNLSARSHRWRMQQSSPRTPGVTVRKPIEKRYGAQARYSMTKYERERRERRKSAS